MPKLKTDTQSCQMAVTGCFSTVAENVIVTTGSDFSGVGAFDQALERLGIKQNKKFACDMDKYARQTYIYNFGEPDYYPENVYDREIPKESLDIYMTSPPCQSFSLAGKRKGEDSKNGVLFYKNKNLDFILVRFFGDPFLWFTSLFCLLLASLFQKLNIYSTKWESFFKINRSLKLYLINVNKNR